MKELDKIYNSIKKLTPCKSLILCHKCHCDYLIYNIKINMYICLNCNINIRLFKTKQTYYKKDKYVNTLIICPYCNNDYLNYQFYKGHTQTSCLNCNTII